MAAILSFGWLLCSLKDAWKSESIDDLIEKLKKGVQKTGAATEEILVIDSARYGAEGKTKDVTNILQAKIVSGRIENFPITNEAFGGDDPIPGVLKMLDVNYTYLGESRSVSIQENKTFSLPE